MDPCINARSLTVLQSGGVRRGGRVVFLLAGGRQLVHEQQDTGRGSVYEGDVAVDSGPDCLCPVLSVLPVLLAGGGAFLFLSVLLRTPAQHPSLDRDFHACGFWLELEPEQALHCPVELEFGALQHGPEDDPHEEGLGEKREGDEGHLRVGAQLLVLPRGPQLVQVPRLQQPEGAEYEELSEHQGEDEVGRFHGRLLHRINKHR